ncbi:MAG: energy-coupling factor transporter transmembrane component T [Succiniclasticum sp.]|jgi:energy-coupling factor transport system permease protein|nr:energy-coupling factor transporter transmembrane component T [Succiniclasticum sp.]MEE3479390.1 energy-coupling factor transporter transmembrane component T [Succiniclasticum sp.]
MLGDITLGQYYPGNSFVHCLDPRTKILVTLLLIVAIFLAQSVPAYVALWVMVFFVIAISKLPFLLVFKSVKPLLFIILLTLAMHVFVGQGETVLYQWKFIRITQEGIAMGIKMSMRLMLLLMISSVLTFTTSPIVLTDGIESLLRPFRCIGVPAHELAMMMTIALRFIPTLLEETDRIIKAQTSRGADFQSGNILQKAKNMLPILIPLFISAFRRADDLAVAMEARCYRGGEGRTRMHQLAYRGGDAAAFVFGIAMIVFLVLLRWGPLAAKL